MWCQVQGPAVIGKAALVLRANGRSQVLPPLAGVTTHVLFVSSPGHLHVTGGPSDPRRLVDTVLRQVFSDNCLNLICVVRRQKDSGAVEEPRREQSIRETEEAFTSFVP